MHDVLSSTSEIASQRLLSEAASQTPVMTSYSAGTATASMYTLHSGSAENSNGENFVK